MDGNSRWAEARGLTVAEGHRAGSRALRPIVETALDAGVDSLAVFAFSTENWARPVEEVDEEAFARNLYAPEMPDPDLLIRTSGELRLSNFLLWQASYAELVFTDTLWPDFGPDEFRSALEDYAQRRRRFGAR